MSQKRRNLSQNEQEMSGTGQKFSLRETGHLSRPALRPGTNVPLSQNQRFAGWLAGASPEQAKRWERMQAGLAADPVQDDQLPPALRGGALEVF